MHRNTGKVLIRFVSGALGISVIWYLFSRMGLGSFFHNLSLLETWIIAPLVAVYSISWVFRGLRLKMVLQLCGTGTGLLRAIGIEFMADLPNQFIPAKLGDSVKIAYMHKAGIIDYKEGTFASITVRFMDLVAVVLLTLLSSVFVSSSITEQYHFYILAVLAIALLLLLSGWVFLYRTSFAISALKGPLTRFRLPASDFAGRIKQNPAGSFKVLLVSVLVWMFDIMTLLIFILAMGLRLTIAETSFVMLLSTVAKLVPVTPNGLGIYEGTMVLILKGMSINESTAFTVALLDHGFMNAYSLLLSIVSIYLLGIGVKGVTKLMEERSR